ncbi:Clp protease N-terminal domain-containing protein [Streptomyces sp. GESEQ-35]|uniref:Clp protease N-terminal domain-containing protein n=1 Tax=Streptomyces sp. GESEQ-35 TaxID=2812657 RepID=UPI001B327FC9|nr:Clp protease N-terminal domain-containing protein [Streptomyces sp. GESEQ-35]
MFERFTKDAREVVQEAVGQAERAGASSVEAEHMLLALLDREGSRASFALASLLGNGEHGKESVRSALVEARRRAGLSQADAEALAGLGIDLSEIVARVEEVHGVGAMSGDRKGRARSGHRPFARGAKDTLTESLRVAAGRRERHIGDEHILLALAARSGVPGEVLADHGVTYEALTRVLYGGGEAKAG